MTRTEHAPATRVSRRLVVAGTLLAVALYVALDWWTALPVTAEAQFVGRQTCAECHQDQTAKFTGSFHDRAMDVATSSTVLGDFNNAVLEHHGITSRMFQRDGRYWVNTEGADGKLADFEVKYVFGVDPLQQYLVEFDRPANMPEHEQSRLQTLRISWDTHRQRWFHLDPPDVKEKLAPDDVLHWTGQAQCWNTMCADCHSTNLQKNFDVRQGRYHTTWSEIDVSCEACHGPGSLHVALARSSSLFWDRRRGYAITSLSGPSHVAEVEACAPCHSRRRVLSGDYRPGEPFHNFFANETLHSMAYHADGQNLDEVYEYGSFTQSKMYHKNIRCSDCHDPHSTQLKYTGNQLCTSCHAHPAGKYDSVAHHHHAPGTPGASCVECHMPEGLFMAVDFRRDHGLRVPRPDLSLQHGTPNACSQCHLRDDRDLPAATKQSLAHYSDWLAAGKRGDKEVAAALRKIDIYCAEAMARWYPESKPRKEDVIVPAFTAARELNPQSQPALAEIASSRELPAIVRATAVMELGNFARPNTPAVRASLEALTDNSPQVRAAAIANLGSLPNDELLAALVPRLSDESRMVRSEAARELSVIFRRDGEREASSGLRLEEHAAYQRALAEYFTSLEQLNDRGAAHIARGVIHENHNELDEAEVCYRTALRLEPNVTGARSHLAALMERRSDEARLAAQQAAQRGDNALAVQLVDPLANLQVLSRNWRSEELQLYARDARLAPNNAAVQYRYGLNLYLNDQLPEAEQALRQAIALQPKQVEFLIALALLLEKQGRPREALPLAQQALALWPDDAGFREIVARLGQATSAGS